MSNPLFCREGGVKMAIFTRDSEIKGGKNDFTKMAASQCYFYTEISRYVSKIC